jgi:hypothetical protein
LTISGGEEAIQSIATKEKVRYIASEYLYHMDCPAFGMFHTFTFAGLPSEVRMPHIDCNYGSYRTRPSAEKTGVVNTACFREGSCCFTEDTYLSTCLTSQIKIDSLRRYLKDIKLVLADRASGKIRSEIYL